MAQRFKFTLSRKDSRLFQLVNFFASLFPLTAQGSITLLVTASALSVFGYGSLDLVVFALSICALAIVLFCLFCSIITGIIIQRRIQKILTDTSSNLSSINIEAGYPNETGFSLPSLGFFPLVKLSWKIETPDEIKTKLRWERDGTIVEEIIPERRFLTDSITRVFSVSDVLGFSHYNWRQTQSITAKALPKVDAANRIPLLRSLTAEDGIPNPSGNPEGDRMEIRPYAPGDSVRNIMWKVYARNRQLNVRLPEKSVFHSKRTVAYLLSSEYDEAAAAAARVAIESHAFGDDWAFAADGTETPCTSIESALNAVAKSRSLGKPYNYGLDNFLRLAVGQSKAHCIVFAATEPAPWNEALKKSIAQFPGQFSLVLATDGFRDEAKSLWWQQLLWRETQPDRLQKSSGSMQELRHRLIDLGQLLESAVIIDRRSGQSFDKNLRRV
jgi:hypothetical protein